MLDTPLPQLPEGAAERFAAVVGPSHAFTVEADVAPYVAEQRGLLPGHSPLVLRPGTVEEVAAIVTLANELDVPVVPQGGNTGLVGGGVPHGAGSGKPAEVVVALSRMDRVLDVDPAGNTMIVEAGCILQRAQEAADEADRLFPLSLGAQGTAQIGGNIATNAGGTGVLAYGNTRDLVMGLEVVLPTGEVWSRLSRLRKDNTGYRMAELFVGAEGTLGIVTKAVLKLFPKPKGREVALVAVHSPDAALALFERARGAAGAQLTAFELISRRAFRFTLDFAETRSPLAAEAPWYVLTEISSGRSREDARELLETVLMAAIEGGEASDAVLAESIAQAQAFWTLREDMSWSQKPHGASIKHDVSVPVAAIPAFIRDADAAVERVCPGGRIVNFGHMGDGNLHYNVTKPEGWNDADFLALYEPMNDAVYDVVLAHEGSISAEHGIGQVKRERLAKLKSPVEMDLMRRVKATFDPKGIMNPGKVL